MKAPLRHWDRSISLTFMLLFCKKWSNYNISSYYFNHKSIKSLSLKKVWDRQSDIVCLFFYKVLFKVKKNWCERLNEIMKLKFVLVFFDSSYPTRPSDTVAKYIIYPYLSVWKIFQMVLSLILVVYPMASKTWLKNALNFTF